MVLLNDEKDKVVKDEEAGKIIFFTPQETSALITETTVKVES